MHRTSTARRGRRGTPATRRGGRARPPAGATGAPPSALALLPLGEGGDQARTLAAVTAELAAGERMDFDGDLIEAVLDSYLAGDENGQRVRLVPGRIAGLVDLGGADAEQAQRRLVRAELIDKLRADAWSESTLEAYGGHVKAWRAWCRTEGIPALPFDPWHVVNFISDYTFLFDEKTGEYLKDSDGLAAPRVTASSAGLRLAALNRAAEFIGLPRPGDNPGVKEVMRGIASRLGRAPLCRRHALDRSLVHRCLTAADGLEVTAVRNTVAILLRARLSATAGQIAALDWPGVDFDGDDAIVELPRRHKHGQPERHRIAPHLNPDLCLVRWLRALRDLTGAAGARVVAQRDCTPMTRQAVHLAVTTAAAQIGGWDALPQRPDRLLARVVARTRQVTALHAARDRAVLLVGFWTALRRSNLSALLWRDLEDLGTGGIAVRVRFSKTDRQGRGKTLWIPASRPGQVEPCPTQALRAWRAAVTEALGRAPHPHEPVFAALTSTGALRLTADGLLRRLSGDGINEAVQRLAIDAGLMPESDGSGDRRPYGAHSLRAGYVTEALRGGKLRAEQVAETTGHKDVRTLMMYAREINGPTDNPTAILFGYQD